MTNREEIERRRTFAIISHPDAGKTTLTEKQSILGWLRALPLEKYTVLVCDFANWADTAPLPCLVLKK